MTFAFWVQWNVIDHRFDMCLLYCTLNVLPFQIDKMPIHFGVVCIYICHLVDIIICIPTDIFNKSFHHLWQAALCLSGPIMTARECDRVHVDWRRMWVPRYAAFFFPFCSTPLYFLPCVCFISFRYRNRMENTRTISQLADLYFHWLIAFKKKKR